MTALETIGLFTVIFATGVGLVVILICACYGGAILKQQWERGFTWGKTEQQVKEALKQ